MGLLYASAKIVQLSLVAAKNSLHLQQLNSVHLQHDPEALCCSIAPCQRGSDMP